MSNDHIVSVGFLTRSDLERLGATFERHFPIPDDDIFAELLDRLDQIDAEPCGDGIMLKPRQRM